MTHRVTLRFTTDSGNEYLYDDVTGMTFTWSPLREQILEAILRNQLETRRVTWQNYSPIEIEREIAFITHWRKTYGAFSRSALPWPEIPPPSVLEEWIRKEVLMQLILIVTEDCNLRCKYCVYGDHYPLTRNRSERTMSYELARRAVDYFFELARPQIQRNPRRVYGLTFYGGEPLLQADLIARILAYVQEKYPNLAVAVMTTNGTLLTEHWAEMFVRFNLRLSVSLDGPRSEHDRNRVFPSGEGSYTTIMENLRRIATRYPRFFKENITAVCVYDWHTDLEAVNDFFLAGTEPVPPAIFVSEVSPHNSDYYQSFTAADRRRNHERMQRLRAYYKRQVITDRQPSSYAQSLVGFPIAACLLRNRMANQRPAFLPYSGACIPGMKICVQTDGRIDICERVNGTYPIGHLQSGGVDFVRVREILAMYREAVCAHCEKCPITKLCSVCYSMTEGNGCFIKDREVCIRMIAKMRESLADFYSIKEANPQADFSFQTDVAHLEHRLLFL